MRIWFWKKNVLVLKSKQILSNSRKTVIIVINQTSFTSYGDDTDSLRKSLRYYWQNELSYWLQSPSLSFHFGVIVEKKTAKEIYPHCCSVENRDARVVFTWMSKEFRICFGFAFLRFLFCPDTFVPFSCPIRSKDSQSWLASARYSALHANHVVTLGFDWLTRLLVSFVTGYFGLDFDIDLKISLCIAFD